MAKRSDDPAVVDQGELRLVAALLFVVSVVCVAHTLWTHARFDTTSTLALMCVIGLPWLALRWKAKRSAPRD